MLLPHFAYLKASIHLLHTFLQAFVVFESPEEAQRACQKDRETFGDKFGDRYVRVYPTLESDIPDMQLAFQQQHMMQQVITMCMVAARRQPSARCRLVPLMIPLQGLPEAVAPAPCQSSIENWERLDGQVM